LFYQKAFFINGSANNLLIWSLKKVLRIKVLTSFETGGHFETLDFFLYNYSVDIFEPECLNQLVNMNLFRARRRTAKLQLSANQIVGAALVWDDVRYCGRSGDGMAGWVFKGGPCSPLRGDAGMLRIR
jgi:hypothetical protein